ncbi:hypothetical protein [Rhodococcus sp. IEGM 1318]|uniref:hypothetical protein n=1 Tax=Rhodococcus sp. IEGM 1318 TaxID=3082226 RepID=UPI002954131E|nr:hypothetical protein [Rhodococcus sp. IEGM 1318]MDV8009464.1 hypothetical protein [Rhodococcus sp. IEGM 1318]
MRKEDNRIAIAAIIAVAALLIGGFGSIIAGAIAIFEDYSATSSPAVHPPPTPSPLPASQSG